MKASNLFIILCCISEILGIVNTSSYCLFVHDDSKKIYKSIAKYSLRLGTAILATAIILGSAIFWEQEFIYFVKMAFVFLIFLPLLIKTEFKDNMKTESEKSVLPFKGILLFMSTFLTYILLSTKVFHQKQLLFDSNSILWATCFGLIALTMHDIAIIFKKIFNEKVDSTLGLISSILIVISGILFCVGSIKLHPIEYFNITNFITSLFEPFLIFFFSAIEVLFVVYELKKSKKFLCSIENFCFSLTLLFLFGTLFFIPSAIKATN